MALYVQCFGRFGVTLNGEALPTSAWKRDKAKQLFQYLLTNRARLIPKERIINDLWPTLDARRGERDFKVAFSALNDALEPERPKRTLAVYLKRLGTSYGINRDADIVLDAELFEQGLLAGSRAESAEPTTAIEQYRAALTLYHGDYLPDVLYEDWSSAERERLTALFLAGATQLGRLLLASGEIVELTVWLNRVIAIDPCWEAAYRLLMRAHYAAGNRPIAIRLYEQCRHALRDELGIAPMASTRQLYQSLINAADDETGL